MKLENARGTKDVLPEEKILRDSIISQIREVFELFGYSPIETPALERFDVLSSKYTGGAEILKETFRLTDQGKRELGMRYDLTVPLARVVGQNPNLKMPFKRYQIEKVWRDGPVSLGRYREFLQADADVIGVKSMKADAECIDMAERVFSRLRIPVLIRANNRKILDAMLEYAGVDEEKRSAAILSIDKLDKVGAAGVEQDLEKQVGLTAQQIAKLMEIISIRGKTEQKILALKSKLSGEKAEQGIAEIEELFSFIQAEKVELDLTLARGLSYYTGTIFEAVPVKAVIKSSVSGGGRYDRMIGMLLGQDRVIPAVGISFGIDRIQDIISAQMPDSERKKTTADVFVIPIKAYRQCLPVLKELRKNNIRADIDLQDRGPSKNLQYANAMNIRHVLIIGEEEAKQEKYKLKDMKTGEEELLTLNAVISRLKPAN